jgi:hypothetical protein
MNENSFGTKHEPYGQRFKSQEISRYFNWTDMKLTAVCDTGNKLMDD